MPRRRGRPHRRSSSRRRIRARPPPLTAPSPRPPRRSFPSSSCPLPPAPSARSERDGNHTGCERVVACLHFCCSDANARPLGMAQRGPSRDKLESKHSNSPRGELGSEQCNSPQRLLARELRSPARVVRRYPFLRVLALEQALLELPLESETLLEPHLQPGGHRPLDEPDRASRLRGWYELPRVLQGATPELGPGSTHHRVDQAERFRLLHREGGGLRHQLDRLRPA